MSVIRAVKPVVLLLLVVASSTAAAASTSTTFNVTTEVQASCQVSATDLAFGIYDPTSLAARTSSSTITVLCTLDTPYTVGLNAGSNPNGSSRRMGTGASRVGYSLYRDGARTTEFSTTVADVSGVGSGASQVHTVYGAMPAGQNVSAGTYSDQITVTLNY